MKGNNILVIAPHSDDEILGCGATMSKLIKEGKNVYVLIVTNGHVGAPELYTEERVKAVREEALKSHEFLGVKKTYFFDYPAPKLDNIASYKLSIDINKLLQELEIDTLFLPHRGDIHKDHKIVFETSLVAARPINNYTVKTIYCYETLSETEWAPPFGDDVFIPTVYVDVSNFIDDKVKAFEYFTIQIKEKPHSRSSWGIRNLSQYRGSSIGVNHAECFMLIRDIF